MPGRSRASAPSAKAENGGPLTKTTSSGRGRAILRQRPRRVGQPQDLRIGDQSTPCRARPRAPRGFGRRAKRELLRRSWARASARAPLRPRRRSRSNDASLQRDRGSFQRSAPRGSHRGRAGTSRAWHALHAGAADRRERVRDDQRAHAAPQLHPRTGARGGSRRASRPPASSLAKRRSGCSRSPAPALTR